MVKNQ